MSEPDREPTSVDEVAARLKLTREALKLSQAALCRQTGISPQTWNNAETGDNRLGLDNANKLRAKFGISLDWLFWGDMRGLPNELAKRIEAIESPAVKRA